MRNGQQFVIIYATNWRVFVVQNAFIAPTVVIIIIVANFVVIAFVVGIFGLFIILAHGTEMKRKRNRKYLSLWVERARAYLTDTWRCLNALHALNMDTESYGKWTQH